MSRVRMWTIRWKDPEKTEGKIVRVKPYRPYPDPPVVEGRITVKRGVKVL